MIVVKIQQKIQLFSDARSHNVSNLIRFELFIHLTASGAHTWTHELRAVLSTVVTQLKIHTQQLSSIQWTIAHTKKKLWCVLRLLNVAINECKSLNFLLLLLYVCFKRPRFCVCLIVPMVVERNFHFVRHVCEFVCWFTQFTIRRALFHCTNGNAKKKSRRTKKPASVAV